MDNIFEFEKKYKDILEDIEEWAYLRIPVAFYLKNKENKKHKEEIKKISKIRKILNKIKKFKKIKNIFYGFKNWFGKYDYLFFSDSGERRFIKNSYMDKIADDIIKRIGKEKVLLIETPNSIHYKNIFTKKIVSHLFLNFLAKLIHVLIYVRQENIKKLKKILNLENINLNLLFLKKMFFSKYVIYKLLLTIYKPKAIFINCAYCNISLIKAAKELGIKTIEVQHGVISKYHFGYNSNIVINNDYLPDILLSFGETVETNLVKTIFPIGSFYLDYLKNNFKSDEKLTLLINNYKIVIGISMQDQEWERKALFDFLIPIAKERKDILFLIIPRKRKDFPQFPTNIIIYDELDCYNTIMHCDIHLTLYSSCALEAPTLGIPNILINYKDFANKYYKDTLSSYHTKIVNNKEEFLNILEQLLKLNKRKIIENNKNVFADNYEKRINNFLKDLL